MSESKLAVSVASLEPSDKSGWLTKQGGSIKTWKRRWGVLKGNTLYYFKTKNDEQATGFVVLDKNCSLKDDSKKKKNMISFLGKRDYKGDRLFFIYFDTPEEMQSWLEALKRASLFGSTTAAATNDANAAASNAGASALPGRVNPLEPTSPVRTKVLAAKAVVPFLKQETTLPSQCWTLWSEGIPPKIEIPADGELHYKTRSDLRFSLSEWCMDGPQTAVVQRIVDFFWAVGAPPHQIDLLNSVGTVINPINLGFWTRLASSGGIDAGWYFNEKMAVDTVFNAMKKSDGLQLVIDWVAANGITVCRHLAHDVSGVPPQITEFRFELPGVDTAAQISVFTEAMKRFAQTEYPEEQLRLFRAMPVTRLTPLELVLVIIDSEVIRVGLYAENPSAEMIQQLEKASANSCEELKHFGNALGCAVPQNVTLLWTKQEKGHSMYKDGFDVILGWDIGSETHDN